MLSREEIRRGYEIVGRRVRRTPELHPGKGAFGLDCQLALKLECLQHSGSFKVRGVFLHALTKEIPAMGMTAASGGNHGAAVAYVARALQCKATIFVPQISSPAKVRRIRSYGAEVCVGGECYNDAAKECEKFAEKSGAMNVHAYDQVETLLGQAAVALEWQKQNPTLDTVLVAVGGGGLIGGMSAWYRGKVKVVACEPVTSSALHAALKAGQPVDVPVAGIAADSLGATKVGTLMFPLAQQYISQSVVVDDQKIADAQALLWKETQLAVEPGGATALAALLSGAYRPKKDERVGVLLCGGNISQLPVLPE